jgi:hypothetical protein
MTKDEALRLALEALEADELAMIQDKDGHMVYLKDQAITAIKEALETKHEFVQWEQFHEHMAGPNYVAPQSTWVGLTDEEISELSKGHMTRNGFARNLESKLKEKNHGN